MAEAQLSIKLLLGGASACQSLYQPARTAPHQNVYFGR